MSAVTASSSAQVIDLAAAEEILASYAGNSGALIKALQDVQDRYHYLPREALVLVGQRLGVPLSDVLRVATFYKAFSLLPRGKHHIEVCMGTACHVRGMPMILDRIQRDLGIAPGQTTSDLHFSLDVLRCIGCCSVSPVMRINGVTYGHMRQDLAARLLRRLQREVEE